MHIKDRIARLILSMSQAIAGDLLEASQYSGPNPPKHKPNNQGKRGKFKARTCQHG